MRSEIYANTSSCDIAFSEGPLNLNWTTIMKTVNEDPSQFFKDGGWKFLETESDNEEEESEEISEFEMSEDEFDEDESEEDESEFDEDASADEGSEMDDNVSGEDWSELEEEGNLHFTIVSDAIAARADKRKTNGADDRPAKRRK
jgi:nucleosome binding factor SPN SPT16 subunit